MASMCSGLSGAESKAMPMVVVRGMGSCELKEWNFGSGESFKCGRCSEDFLYPA